MKEISQILFDPSSLKSFSRPNSLTDFDGLGNKLFVFSRAFILLFKFRSLEAEICWLEDRCGLFVPHCRKEGVDRQEENSLYQSKTFCSILYIIGEQEPRSARQSKKVGIPSPLLLWVLDTQTRMKFVVVSLDGYKRGSENNHLLSIAKVYLHFLKF